MDQTKLRYDTPMTPYQCPPGAYLGGGPCACPPFESEKIDGGRAIEALRHVAPHSQTVLFDVSFPEKLLNIIAKRGEIFSLKFTKYRLAAGLRPDPLGELKRSPRPPSRNKGAYF